jgi:hypothetical protein
MISYVERKIKLLYSSHSGQNTYQEDENFNIKL